TIKNLSEKINKFNPIHIKDAVLEKYKEYGIPYLYKLCKVSNTEKSDSIATYASTIACLLLEHDHNAKLEESLSTNIVICEKIIDIYKNIESIRLIENQVMSISNTINE